MSAPVDFHNAHVDISISTNVKSASNEYQNNSIDKGNVRMQTIGHVLQFCFESKVCSMVQYNKELILLQIFIAVATQKCVKEKDANNLLTS